MTALLFFHPRGLLGRLISAVSHHADGVPEVSHVAVLTGSSDETDWVIEAVAPEGVRSVGYPKGSGILVPVNLRDLTGFREKTVGRLYDWTVYPWLAFDGFLSFFGKSIKRNPLDNKDRWVCSELAAYCLREHAVDPRWRRAIDDGPSCWSPQRLANVVWKELAL